MGISRRNLLKQAGVVAAGGFLSQIPGPALAHGDEEQPAPGMEEHGPEGAGKQRVRRWVMVIDLRKCDGCTGLGVPPQCTQYCNWARFVPEDQQWIEVFESREEKFPGAEPSFLPAPCMQCQNAPCVNVCPVGATFHSPEGTVLVDQQRCIGCRLCMAACPYDRRFFNWGEPVQPQMAKDAPYNVQTQVPAMRGTVMKCDFCTDRLSAGGLPSCIEGCPRGAMYVGDLEEGVAANGSGMVALSTLLNEAGVRRHKEELGTEPRVFYIPGHGENATGELGEGGHGHGEEEPGHAEEEAEPPQVEEGEPRLMTDRLEWPWRRIMQAEAVGTPPESGAASG